MAPAGRLLVLRGDPRCVGVALVATGHRKGVGRIRRRHRDVIPRSGSKPRRGTARTWCRRPGCRRCGRSQPALVPFSCAWLAAALVTPWPVAKLMPSWQAPQASRLGTFIQLSPSLVLAVRTRGFRRTVMALGAVALVLREPDLVVPLPAVFVALLTSRSPMWILWMRFGRSPMCVWWITREVNGAVDAACIRWHDDGRCRSRWSLPRAVLRWSVWQRRSSGSRCDCRRSPRGSFPGCARDAAELARGIRCTCGRDDVAAWIRGHRLPVAGTKS